VGEDDDMPREEAQPAAVARGDRRTRRGWAVGEGEEENKVEGKGVTSGSHMSVCCEGVVEYR
jgi:hypothetical protein